MLEHRTNEKNEIYEKEFPIINEIIHAHITAMVNAIGAMESNVAIFTMLLNAQAATMMFYAFEAKGMPEDIARELYIKKGEELLTKVYSRKKGNNNGDV